MSGRSVVLVILTLLSVILMTTSPVAAKPASHGQARGGNIEVGASSKAPTQAHRDSGLSKPGVTGPPVTVVRLPACGRNAPGLAGSDDYCGISNSTCPPHQTLVTTWTRTGDAPWVNDGTLCTTEGETTAEIALPTITANDLRRVGLPASPVHLQPGTGQALLNVPVILHTTTGTVVRQTTVLGYPVTIRATPVSWTWTFDDGTALGPTTDPGHPYPDQTLTHTWTTPGDHQLTLTTTYSGEYTIAGLPYRPVEGTATVTSAATPLHVREGTTVLTN